MPPIVLTNPIHVANRLDQLGWTREQLLEVVAAMVSARNDTTENDPSSAPGWMAWKDGTRRLREIGLRMGYRRDETNNVPSIVNEKRGLRIAVCNTDDGTCVEEERVPQNRTKKGPATDYSVANNQGWLFAPRELPRVVPISQGARPAGLISTYYLCVYHEGDDVRAELSCPVAVSGGFFSDFVERILLLRPGEDHGWIGVVPDVSNAQDDPEFEIPVTRKR